MDRLVTIQKLSDKIRSRLQRATDPEHVLDLSYIEYTQLVTTLTHLDKVLMDNLYRPPLFSLQSADHLDTGHIGTASAAPIDEVEEQEEQILTFMDTSKGESIVYNPIADSSFYTDTMKQTTIEGFMSRPLPIHEFEYTSSGFTDIDLKPWYLYFNNSQIKKKIDNYGFLSCNLHIKIVVNSTPFNYGAAIASYVPLAGFNPLPFVDSVADGIPLSQLPHIWILPAMNMGGEMTLPFHYYQNWLDVTSAKSLQDMGSLLIRNFYGLLNANGAASPTCSVQIFAWATDVRLAAPTVGLALQSVDEIDISKIRDFQHYYHCKKLLQVHAQLRDAFRRARNLPRLQSGDEWGTGPVSLPASAIAAAGRALSDVPIIGTYAKATEIGFSAVSKIASLFGWTNVPVIRDVMPYKSMPFGGLSSAHIASPVDKLTLDPKNELSVDPKTVGLDGTDELCLNYLMQRESYLGTANWATTGAIDDLLFQATVQPQMAQSVATTGGLIIQSTPMAHFSHLFDNWRGDVIFRFKFICTQYHRGRIRVTWDPVSNIVSDPNSIPVAFTQIVDLTETTDMEVRVPYLQRKLWLRTRNPNDDQRWFVNSGFTNQRDPEYDNGTLTVRVFTELSTPTATGTIAMFVFVRGADNLELGNPRDLPFETSYFSLQSQDEMSIQHIVAGEGGKLSDERYLVNFGEAVHSLRTILRRTTIVDHIPLLYQGDGGANTVRVVQIWQTKYPPPRGYDPNGFDSAKGLVVPLSNFKFNYTYNVPFSHISICFVGMRGSMIWHYNVDSRGGTDGPVQTAIVRRIRSLYPSQIVTHETNSTNSNNIKKFFTDSCSSGAGGMHMTNQVTQAGLSALLPQYNPYRMVSAAVGGHSKGQEMDDTDTESFQLELLYKPATDSTGPGSTIVSRYASIGTDFNLFFFRCIPTIWWMSKIPDPDES